MADDALIPPPSAAPQSGAYRVLARTYRPMTFEDMIGQEAMVKTLTNAFAAGRVAHAFMLTGVRGIGKTTTARLLARALNYAGPHDGPSVKLDPPGIHCEAINAGSHMDVMEMDAASRTGVADIREILDGVRYAPVSARYKVYIIDEVHMLSANAFNALLKTLEEPPDHAKFIFATTEIRKIPITVLSRCQRFDLRRVGAPQLAAHLSSICEKEGANISEDGLMMIARAAEGSVRDGLSLLDQAIVQNIEAGAVSADDIRTMLGLADRTRVMALLADIIAGNSTKALALVRTQYEDGAAPEIIVRDLLDCCHLASRAKLLGSDGGYDLPPDQIKALIDLSANLSNGQLSRLWQILLKAHQDVRTAPHPLAACEMAIISLCAAGDLPPPELAAQIIQALNSGRAPTASGAASPAVPADTKGRMQANTPSQAGLAAAPISSAEPATNAHEITSLGQLAEEMPRSQSNLRYDIRKFVRPALFEPGKILYAPAPGAPADLPGRISAYLQSVTRRAWVVSADKNAQGAPSLTEAEKTARDAQSAAEDNDPIVVAMRDIFPDATVEFRDAAPKSNIVEGNFAKNHID